MFWELNMLSGSLFGWLACCIHLYVFFLSKNLFSSSSTHPFSIESLCFALDRFSKVGWSFEFFFWPLYLLDRSSTHSRSIEISGFLLYSTSTASWSIEMISFSFYLFDTFSTDVLIHRAHVFAINITLTTPRQILFCWDLVLDKFSTDPQSIQLHFSIYSWGAILFSFLLSHLDRTSSL